MSFPNLSGLTLREVPTDAKRQPFDWDALQNDVEEQQRAHAGRRVRRRPMAPLVPPTTGPEAEGLERREAVFENLSSVIFGELNKSAQDDPKDVCRLVLVFCRQLRTSPEMCTEDQWRQGCIALGMMEARVPMWVHSAHLFVQRESPEVKALEAQYETVFYSEIDPSIPGGDLFASPSCLDVPYQTAFRYACRMLLHYVQLVNGYNSMRNAMSYELAGFVEELVWSVPAYQRAWRGFLDPGDDLVAARASAQAFEASFAVQTYERLAILNRVARTIRIVALELDSVKLFRYAASPRTNPIHDLATYLRGSLDDPLRLIPAPETALFAGEFLKRVANQLNKGFTFADLDLPAPPVAPTLESLKTSSDVSYPYPWVFETALGDADAGVLEKQHLAADKVGADENVYPLEYRGTRPTREIMQTILAFATESYVAARNYTNGVRFLETRQGYLLHPPFSQGVHRETLMTRFSKRVLLDSEGAVLYHLLATAAEMKDVVLHNALVKQVVDNANIFEEMLTDFDDALEIISPEHAWMMAPGTPSSEWFKHLIERSVIGLTEAEAAPFLVGLPALQQAFDSVDAAHAAESEEALANW